MGFFDKAKEAVGLTGRGDGSSSEQTLQVKEEQPEESSICPKLTYQQRVMGFGISFLLGYLITFASFRHFVQMLEGDPVPFAVTFTFGNILALLSSMFLCGPERQLKLMMDEKRKMTAIVYVSCLLGTLVMIFLPLPQALRLLVIFVLVLVQLSAGVWYNLSYIPFGRRTFLNMAKRAVGADDDAGQSVV